MKVDVDQCPQTATKWRVINVPTILMFKGGEVISNKVGAAPKAALQSWIETAI